MTRLIFTVLLLFSSAALSAEPLQLNVPAPILETKKVEVKPVKIVVFGDSLMSGYGISEYRDFASTLERNLLQKGLSNFDITNKSQNGSTTEDGLNRIAEVTKLNPDIAIIELGINDVFKRLPLQATYNNLSKIIETLQEKKILVLLVGQAAPITAGEEYVKKFDGMYKYLSAQYKIPLYPNFSDGVAGNRRLLQNDGLHPNQMGVEVMVDKVSPIVEKMVKYKAEKKLEMVN